MFGTKRDTVSLDTPPRGSGQDARMPSHTPSPSHALPLLTRLGGTRRIERRNAAIERRNAVMREHAEAMVELAAAHEIADASSTTAASAKPKINRWQVAITALVGIPVNGLALLGAMIAVALGTDFWKGRLDAAHVDTNVHILGTPITLNLPPTIPVGFEGTIWALTLMATVLAVFLKRYTAYTRPMWAIATAVALINGIHNAGYDLLGGLGLGALSLASPYLVHKYVLFVRAMLTGKTYIEAARETLNRWKAIGRAVLAVLQFAGGLLASLVDFLLHPRLTVSAVLLWRMHRDLAYGDAHRVVVAHYRDLRADRSVNRKREDRTYHKALIDLIDPTEVRPSKTVKVRRPAPVATTTTAPAVPAAVAVDAIPAPEVAPAATAASAPAAPSPERASEPVATATSAKDELDGAGRHAKNADVIDLKLASEFGEKRGRSLAEWLARVGENGGQGPSFAEIDKKLFGKVTKTTSQAVAAYIEKYGDPRTKAVNE